MRLSENFTPTLKEVPADAVIPSHQLMLRAGLIRPLAAGIYSYLPLGWRAARNVIDIIREEQDAIGGQEFQLPAINPIELWDETGRNSDFGGEMFRVTDRKGRTLALAPTHEEIICSVARGEIRSYKQLPQMWYQIQTKFRDEPRPRSGELRTRQFIMKDAYSLNATEQSLDESYNRQHASYCSIFGRVGIEYFVVGASSGLMGGSGSQEFMAESDAGEDTCVLCNACDYAANLEIAVSGQSYESRSDQPVELKEVATPGHGTIEEVAAFLQQEPDNFIKSILYIADDQPILVCVTGCDEINESKLEAQLGALFRQAEPEEVLSHTGTPVGYLGAVGLPDNIKVLADNRLQGRCGMVTGALKEDFHISGVDVARDLDRAEFHDLITVKADEPCPNCGQPLSIIRAIEIGHIFKLGTKYSSAMGATFLDESGKEQPIIMGSYGIGVGRMLATYIEQNHDENGIIWNRALTPYQVHVVPLNAKNESAVQLAGKIYDDLRTAGLTAVYDDRPLRGGFKMKDADLLGFPLQVILGDRTMAEGKVEVKIRRSGERLLVEPEAVVAKLQELLTNL
ncbi:MAG: proline--tRNA ligase [Candidatus Delongbacteria bacterium]|nr:proline--tRNA ligase [Candidatus Delongbacteria bacterium]